MACPPAVPASYPAVAKRVKPKSRSDRSAREYQRTGRSLRRTRRATGATRRRAGTGRPRAPPRALPTAPRPRGIARDGNRRRRRRRARWWRSPRRSAATLPRASQAHAELGEQARACTGLHESHREQHEVRGDPALAARDLFHARPPRRIGAPESHADRFERADPAARSRGSAGSASPNSRSPPSSCELEVRNISGHIGQGVDGER